MNIHHLIARLELAAKKALYFADQEKEKSLDNAPYSTRVHNLRAHSREFYFREKKLMVESLISEIKSLEEDALLEEKEELFFVARKLIAEITTPWIRRSMLHEELYREIYRDPTFEPYARGLESKLAQIKVSNITLLGLPHHIEEELVNEIKNRSPDVSRKGYIPTIDEVVKNHCDLKHMFKDSWTQKSNLVYFRLYELGMLETL
jgi:hypothetical protein